MSWIGIRGLTPLRQYHSTSGAANNLERVGDNVLPRFRPAARDPDVHERTCNADEHAVEHQLGHNPVSEPNGNRKYGEERRGGTT
jgi:hypothetical protein